jgi:tripartite-type tricarboxylate transporter receptor subunit TctC
LTDFAGVTPISSAPNVLVISPSKNIKALKELLAMGFPKRASALPDVPTMLESGLPGSEFNF